MAHELAVSAVSRRADKLASQASSLAAARDKSAIAALKTALASPSAGKAASLAAGAEAVALLFPSAACVIAGALSDAGSPAPGSVAVARSAPWKPSSARGAPPHAAPLPGELFSPASSAAAALAAAATAADAEEVLDSASTRGGLHAFADWPQLAEWAAPVSAGAPPPPRRCVTIALSAGGRTTGFFVIVFAQREGSAAAAASASSNSEPPPLPDSLPTPPLREACVLLGASLALLRLESLIREGLDRALESTGVARQPASSPIGAAAAAARSSSLGSLAARSFGARGGGAEALAPARDDGRAAIPIALLPPSGFGGAEAAAEPLSLDDSSEADERTLRRWDVDASALPSDELHRLLRAMFVSSGLPLGFDVTLPSFASFTADIEASYRENAFHHWCAALRAMSNLVTSAFSLVCVRRHAWNVCHAAWLLVESGGMRRAELVDDVGSTRCC